MKLLSRLCAFLLALLGVASCDSDSIKCEYGTPNADFQIKGKVTDMENNPIKGIQVKTPESFGVTQAYTSADGTFDVTFKDFPPSNNNKINLTFIDIDGVDNGDFADKTESIQVTQVGEASGSWYEGSFYADNVIVKMEKK